MLAPSESSLRPALLECAQLPVWGSFHGDTTAGVWKGPFTSFCSPSLRMYLKSLYIFMAWPLFCHQGQLLHGGLNQEIKHSILYNNGRCCPTLCQTLVLRDRYEHWTRSAEITLLKSVKVCMYPLRLHKEHYKLNVCVGLLGCNAVWTCRCGLERFGATYCLHLQGQRCRQ
jgi:hypothetical protein